MSQGRLLFTLLVPPRIRLHSETMATTRDADRCGEAIKEQDAVAEEEEARSNRPIHDACVSHHTAGASAIAYSHTRAAPEATLSELPADTHARVHTIRACAGMRRALG